MVQENLTVSNKSGLHARPAALLVQTSSKFKSEVKIIKGEAEVNAKSIVGIMGLGAKQGQEVTLHINGPDEGDALAAIKDLFRNNFGE